MLNIKNVVGNWLRVFMKHYIDNGIREAMNVKL